VSAALRSAVKHHRVRRVKLRVTIKDTSGKSTTATLTIKTVR
jgi:hypothetical protein